MVIIIIILLFWYHWYSYLHERCAKLWICFVFLHINIGKRYKQKKNGGPFNFFLRDKNIYSIYCIYICYVYIYIINIYIVYSARKTGLCNNHDFVWYWFYDCIFIDKLCSSIHLAYAVSHILYILFFFI